MKIKDIMIPNVEFVSPDDSLEHAALKIKETEICLVPVCDRNNGIVGILTDRDITVRVESAGLDPRSTPVRQVMSRAVSYCYADEDAHEAARLMRGQRPARILVLHRDERLAGIVSLAGVPTNNGMNHGAGDIIDPCVEPWEGAGEHA
jgi:CBS domain-containing protein